MTTSKQMQTFDVMVLGAGIVGVSTAAHLRRLGLDVALIDRQHPGGEASAGNAGVVQHNGFVPQGLPKNPVAFLKSSFNLGGPFSYRPLTLAKMLPWIRQYVKASYGEAAEAYCKAIMPLRQQAVKAHLDLAEQSNAGRFYRKGGWLHLYRTPASYDADDMSRYYARIYGVDYKEMDGSEASGLEPGLKISGMKAVHWTESWSVSNPAAVVDAFWRRIHPKWRPVFPGGRQKAGPSERWVAPRRRAGARVRPQCCCLPRRLVHGCPEEVWRSSTRWPSSAGITCTTGRCRVLPCPGLSSISTMGLPLHRPISAFG